MRWIGLVPALAALLAACASPAERIDHRALVLSYASITLQGSSFLHRVYLHRPHEVSETIHVYIEHDGVPWVVNGTKPSDDPTPRKPLMLELMAMDFTPSIYLGRPCYFGLNHDINCNPLVWTHRRYSEEVVDSMAVALRKFLAEHSFREIVLIGHSGGGTLAVLLAARIPETIAVVTLAGNLSVGEWTAYHDYSPLIGSLDPIRQPPLPPNIVQCHFVGAKDRNTLPSFIQNYTKGQPAARVTVIPEFDHGCCWRSLWPRILSVFCHVSTFKTPNLMAPIYPGPVRFASFGMTTNLGSSHAPPLRYGEVRLKWAYQDEVHQESNGQPPGPALGTGSIFGHVTSSHGVRRAGRRVQLAS